MFTSGQTYVATTYHWAVTRGFTNQLMQLKFISIQDITSYVIVVDGVQGV